LPSLRLFETPDIACSRIKKNRHKEQVDQASSDLGLVNAIFAGPSLHEGIDACDVSNLEMLPATVRGDSVVLVRAEIALRIVNIIF
jgi:hypothetical protein